MDLNLINSSDQALVLLTPTVWSIIYEDLPESEGMFSLQLLMSQYYLIISDDLVFIKLWAECTCCSMSTLHWQHL